MPGSISTNAPKLVRLRTLPLMRVPTGYLSGSTIHGSCSVCFMPSEIFSSFGSTLSTTASIVSPMRDELRRMTDVARPAHLADVHEAFDARLELDERAVVRDRDDLARDARADRILLGDVLPRIALELLEAERDALALPIDVEHLDLELRADRDELGRMRDAAPRHVGDVEQAVDAAEIDECTEVGDVLDDALPHLILLELLHQLLALAGTLVLEDHATRDDDVAAALVELDDLELELLAEQLVDVRHATERDLRTRAGTRRRP